jgi:cysteine-rich repeat protein
LVIQNFDIGIQIGGDNNKIEGNFFGTDVTGTSVEANIIGVSLVGGTDNFIGVDANNEEARNLISGNINAGIAITAATLVSQPHNHIRGNLIGTDITGLAALGNTFFGIQITDSDGSDIGGDSPFQRNVISANGAAGIVIGGTPAESVNNVITGNYIGTGVDGETDLGNQGSGIALGLGAAATEIGRIFSPGQGNRIAFNAFGISIDNSDGIFGIGILNNSIFSNDFIGIDLESNGVVTPNDPGDGDTGPNGLQNFPILSAATVDDGNLVVEGDLDSVSGQFRVEFFVNDVCSPTGNGEGKTFVGSVDVDTSVDEHFSVSFAAQPGAFVTATASRNLGFETSEFSPCQAIVAEICDNGLDDEGDGDSDCDDADCAAFPACAPLPSCGNGTLESGEQCDDGNTTNGDGCNSNCQQETSGGGGGCGLAGTVSAPPSFALSIYLLVLSTIAATRKLRRRSFPST